MRRAGSPQQLSSSPSTVKFTPAVFRILTMALGTFMLRSSRAPVQPTQYRMSGSLDSAQYRQFQTFEPGGPRRGCSPEWMTFVSQAFERILDILGKLRLPHSQVPPHIYDLVNMLNVNRTGLHTGTAGSAVPEHLIGDYFRNHVLPGFDRLFQ